MCSFWIKWEKGLTRKQEILQIAARLMIPPAQAAGTLMLVMEWLDDNVSSYSDDGHALVTLKSLSVEFIDGLVGVSGFGDAMAEVGWLRVDNGVLQFVNAGKHNGITAKTRADAALRQSRSRNSIIKQDAIKRVPLSRQLRRFVMERDRYRCVYCGTQSSYDKEYPENSRRGIIWIDHILPVTRGGTDDAENLVCACLKCNNSKNDSTIEECGFELKYLQPELKYSDGLVTIMSHERVTELGRFSSALLSSDTSTKTTGRPTTVIPLLLSTDTFAEAWRAWLRHRREIKKPVIPGSEHEREQLKMLEGWGEERAIAALKFTIFKGWQGIKEPTDRDLNEFSGRPAPWAQPATKPERLPDNVQRKIDQKNGLA